MASIVGSATYGEGHKVVLKDSTQLKTAAVVGQLTKEGYKLGETVFSITKTKTKSDKTIIVTTTGNDKIFLKDPKNKVVLFTGSASAINNIFNHFTANAKADTRQLTAIKEKLSMWMFESVIEKGIYPKEDVLINKLSIAEKSLYDHTYYESAVKQAKVLKPKIKGNGFSYERQAEGVTNALYALGRKLSGKANDNWNPADVWMIKKTFTLDKLLASTTIDQLNEGIAAAYKKGVLIPISLKQVTTDKAKFAVIDVKTMLTQPLEYDMSFEKVDLSDTFNNFILQTKSGFAVRAGFKASATTLNVSLEGRFLGAGYQLGAIDAGTFPVHISNKYGYTVRGSVNVPKTDHAKAKTELKAIIDRYGRFSNTLADFKAAESAYNKGNALVKNRFANLMSYMYALMVAPKTSKAFKELMTYCFYSSKKLVADASMYVIIENG
jgi:hypothetical protein